MPPANRNFLLNTDRQVLTGFMFYSKLSLLGFMKRNFLKIKSWAFFIFYFFFSPNRPLSFFFFFPFNQIASSRDPFFEQMCGERLNILMWRGWGGGKERTGDNSFLFLTVTTFSWLLQKWFGRCWHAVHLYNLSWKDTYLFSSEGE